MNALVDYSVITGRDGAAESIAASLEKEKQEILSFAEGEGKDLFSQQSCYYFYETDGYEALFSPDKLESMTPAELSKAVSSNPSEYSGNVIGRAVYSPKWYLALPTDETVAIRFTEGNVYEIDFSSHEALKMTLEKICVSENGDAYLLMSCLDLSIAASMPRTQNVKILMGSLTGYRIPAAAMTTVNGERGVYILIGTVVEFRRVTVIGEMNGYYIVSTFEEDADSNSVSHIPYLNVNDLIIISGNDLYDGKLLD